MNLRMRIKNAVVLAALADVKPLCSDLAKGESVHPMTGSTVFELNESNARLTAENDAFKLSNAELLAALKGIAQTDFDAFEGDKERFMDWLHKYCGASIASAKVGVQS